MVSDCVYTIRSVWALRRWSLVLVDYLNILLYFTNHGAAGSGENDITRICTCVVEVSSCVAVQERYH